MQIKNSFHVRPSESLRAIRAWLPNRGTVIFVFAILAILFMTNRVGAFSLLAPTATSTAVVSYQGRLTNASNTPLTGSYNMTFRLYSASSGGSALWTEQWNNVQVASGLFNVLLGSTTAIPQNVITGNNTLWLGITVGSDGEMTPRVQLGSVPFATQALTVPDGSITTAKLNLVSGNVGIGTASPLQKLHIFGTNIEDSAIAIENGGTGGHRWGIYSTNSSFTQGAGKLMFYRPWADGTGGSMVIDENGNVGIGTTNPLSRLHVRTGGTDGIRLTNPVGGGGSWVMYTGDSGCFGNSLGIGPVVTPGTGLCGGDAGTAITIGTNGSFTATGTKSAVVKTDSYGQRKLYAIEAPDVRFSDEGIATLQNGVARISLDPIFLETIEGRYIVHVTPYGNATLYVDEIGADYFVVKARENNSNIEFAWRLSAVRKGYQGTRLERMGE